jgi:hypothetical protein
LSSRVGPSSYAHTVLQGTIREPPWSHTPKKGMPRHLSTHGYPGCGPSVAGNNRPKKRFPSRVTPGEARTGWHVITILWSQGWVCVPLAYTKHIPSGPGCWTLQGNRRHSRRLASPFAGRTADVGSPSFIGRSCLAFTSVGHHSVLSRRVAEGAAEALTPSHFFITATGGAARFSPA